MTDKRNIAFLAGMFPAQQKDFILEHSIGVVQNAADAYQKNMIAGLAAQEDISAVVVNLPFISAWPSSFKRAWFPAVSDSENNVPIEGCGFANASLIRYFARLLSAFSGLRRGRAANAEIILVYSAHVPFMLAAMLAGRLFARRQLAIIVLDLPEYMGATGIAQFLFGRINQWLFYRLVSRFDRVIVLTEAMVPRLGVKPTHAIVVEGIAADPASLPTPKAILATHKGATQSILYTGTLALRYGIVELVNGFRMLERQDIELWICGAGEGAEQIIAAAKSDTRIRFFGQVDRLKALELQAEADFLVNPREGVDEFVRYSFPSKIMEYFVSARPVIMHKLAGIPDEYDNYFIEIRKPGAEGIFEAINRALSMSHNERYLLGITARNFVLEKKNPRQQVRRIVELLSRDLALDA